MKALILGARRRVSFICEVVLGGSSMEQEQPHEDSRLNSEMSGFQRNLDRSPQTATALNCSESCNQEPKTEN
jgi:hypothetical protein